MACSCVFSQNQDYLRMDVSGNWTPGKEADEAIKFWAQAADVCRENEQTHVLAVFDIPGSMPTMAAFEVASDPEAFGWDRRVKVALVYTHRERFESNLFSETVAVNRYYQVKAFQDESAARDWLLQS